MSLDDDTLQRYFDGELSATEEREVRAQIERQPEAQARLEELAVLRSLIRDTAFAAADAVDADALFARIQQSVAKQKALGFSERLQVIRGEWRDQKRGALIPMLGVAAMAAAALVIVLTPRETKQTSAPAATLAESDVVHGSQVENVDFGSNTGTVFEVENQGATAAVVWISDDEESAP